MSQKSRTKVIPYVPPAPVQEPVLRIQFLGPDGRLQHATILTDYKPTQAQPAALAQAAHSLITQLGCQLLRADTVSQSSVEVQ